MINNLSPHINMTLTEDDKIVLHLHSFMEFVRQEGKRYQSCQKKGETYQLNLDVSKVIQECFSELDCVCM